MRCKNCGTYNDDNRYICETCGSPLYDDGEIISDDKTQTFQAVQESEPAVAEPVTVNTPNTPNMPKSDKGSGSGDIKDKKNIIVIAILAVVLIAVIASIIVVAQSKSKEPTSETSDSVSYSSTDISTKYTTENTTEKTTTTTTEKTTASTTEKTTVSVWYINVSSSGGGSVSGGGQFQNGEKVTLKASADSGYEFEGWYSSGVKVSNSKTYTFTANENVSYSAQFSPVSTTERPTESSTDEVVQ